MWFMQPGMLWWGLLALVPLALYFFRHRPRTQRVSTLLFFKALAREHQESAWLRHLKKLLSLLLTLLVIAAATLGLSRLIVAPRSDDLKGVVILIDRSASMAATDEKGVSRLDEALRRVRQRLAGLPSGVPVSVMAYDNRPETLLPRSIDRREVERALQRVKVRPIAGDTDKAIRRAIMLAGRDVPAAIWHATDEPAYQPPFAPQLAPGVMEAAERLDAAASDLAAAQPGRGEATSATDDVPQSTRIAGSDLRLLQTGEVRIEHVHVALPEPLNVGITGFAMRKKRLQEGKYELFVELSSTTREPREVRLRFLTDGMDTAVMNAELQPGRPWRPAPDQMPEIIANEGQVMTLIVEPADGSRDVLAVDDEVHFRVPRSRPLEVVWIAEEPSAVLGMALMAHAGDQVEIHQGSPNAWPVKGADVAIFEGWLPEQWPEDLNVIAINPPGKLGPIEAQRLRGDGLPVDHVRPTNPKHPLMLAVASGRVKLMQTAALSVEGLLEPLWVGPAGALLAAGEVGRQRVVVMAFDPMRFVAGEAEQLALLRSFPILLGNALFWTGEPATHEGGLRNLRTGESVALGGQKLTWLSPKEGKREESEQLTVSYRGPLVELDRVGLWQTENYVPEEPQKQEAGSAALLSMKETVLPGLPAEAAAVKGDADSASWWQMLGGDQLSLLLWIILGVLLLESWLFHRHAVY